MAKSQEQNGVTAYRARRKARFAALQERFVNGTILRICEADKWGIQEIKLILNAGCSRGWQRVSRAAQDGHRGIYAGAAEA